MGTMSGDFHNLSGEVLGGLEVEENLSAKFLAEVALGIATVDCDDPHSPCAGILNGEKPKTTASSRKNNPLARLD